MRFPILDGFRGFFLVFMTLAHASHAFGSQLYRLSYHSLGWADAAHGFVFLSGLVIGLVYMRKMERGGAAEMGTALRRRMRTIYGHTLFLLVVTTLLALVARENAPALFGRFGTAPLPFFLLSSTLLSGPMFADVLQLYLVFMLFTPLALRAIARGQALGLVAVSLCLWTFAQFGLVRFALDGLEGLLGLDALRLQLGLGFDRVAWQAVYFGGLLIGAQLARGRFDPAMFRDPRWTPVAAVCLVAALGFAVLHVAAPRLLPDPPASRPELSLVYAANVLADLGLVTWLLIAGPQSSVAVIRHAAAWLRAIFTWKPLVFLGRQSLPVYTWHVLVIYLLSSLLPWQGFGFPERELLVVAVILSLFLPAWIYERRGAARRAAAPQGGAAAS